MKQLPKPTEKIVGIIGHHIAHTLSPAMHTAAFKKLGIPFVFGVFDVAREFLPALVTSLRMKNIAGANVTIPHKEEVMRLLDEVTDDAARLGAVNVVVNRDGVLTGYNTDVVGVKQSLESVRVQLRGASILILGSGGGARAVVYALSKGFSPGMIRIHNRSRERAVTMVDEFRKLFPSVRFDIVADQQSFTSAIAGSTLIVNTTSVGMTPNVESLPVPDHTTFSNQQIIFDIIYNPVETALLRKARVSGAKAINGVDMLVYQGAAAFELWTGKKFPVELARSVLLDALTAKKK